MLTFSQTLPQQFNQPLPAMMAQLTPSPQHQSKKEFGSFEDSGSLTEDDIRQLADAVAAWHLYSPLGICLRRSLLRYHFLREAKVPVVIVFGARLKHNSEGGGIGGHAWLTLNDAPYYENPADYQGFVPMYIYPADGPSGQ
jgi:hypothetical protein